MRACSRRLRGSQQGNGFFHGGQCRDFKSHHGRNVYGRADTAVAEVQTQQRATIGVLTSTGIAAGGLPPIVMVHMVARVIEYMLYARLPAVVAAVADIIHARPCPHKADRQQNSHYLQTSFPHCHSCRWQVSLLHFGCKGSAFLSFPQIP